MAWHYAKYVEGLAQTARSIYNIPLYVLSLIHIDVYKRQMYYSVAMNAKAESPTEINYWAQRVEKLYERDSLLCLLYTSEHLQLFTAVTGLQMEKIGQPL